MIPEIEHISREQPTQCHNSGTSPKPRTPAAYRPPKPPRRRETPGDAGRRPVLKTKLPLLKFSARAIIKGSLARTVLRLDIARTSSALRSARRKRSSSCTFPRLGKARMSSPLPRLLEKVASPAPHREPACRETNDPNIPATWRPHRRFSGHWPGAAPASRR